MPEISKILIVEDEILSALVLKNFLEQNNYIITDICSTGEDAILSVKNNLPDLILMDIQLAGDLNGIESAEKILNQSKVRLFFITGYNDIKIREKAMALNPDAYFTKPFLNNEILNKITEIIWNN